MTQRTLPEARVFSDVLVVAVAGRRAGLLSRLAQGFRFHASNHQFDAMDGRLFASVEDARMAADEQMTLFRRYWSSPHP